MRHLLNINAFLTLPQFLFDFLARLITAKDQYNFQLSHQDVKKIHSRHSMFEKPEIPEHAKSVSFALLQYGTEHLGPQILYCAFCLFLSRSGHLVSLPTLARPTTRALYSNRLMGRSARCAITLSTSLHAHETYRSTTLSYLNHLGDQ